MTLHEFAVIEKYFRVIARTAEGVVLGPGDDCAIIEPLPGEQICVSTDTLIENVHFPIACRPEVIAQRTVAANLSDLAAMGAKPMACLLALSLPGIDEIWLKAFASALSGQLDRNHLPLVGGNLSRGELSLTMTVMGRAPAGKPVRRSTAQVGDHLYVSGTPGDAGQGLALVRAGKTNGYLVERYEYPTPRVELGLALRDIASAMIDVSDGLAGDIGQLCAASGIGAVINTGLLRLSDELRSAVGQQAAIELALYAGDDYELCFTAPPAMQEQVAMIAERCGVPLTRIGEMVDSGLTIHDATGNPVEVRPGYRHFS